MARNKNRRPVAAAEPIEILEDSGKPELGIDFGIMITTSLALIGALAALWMYLGAHYDKGPLA